MGYLIAALMGYLLGSSSMTYYLGKRNHVDARTQGTGNLGASNATVLMGWRAGVLVAIHDIGKGCLAVLLAGFLFPELEAVDALAGIACVLGHIFPFYLRFKGGKGLAAYLGMTLALDWRLSIAVMLLLVIVTVATDFIALGTISVVVVFPAALGLMTGKLSVTLMLLPATVLIVCKHWVNIQRIRAGTEIGLRSTAKGKHRVK